MRNATLLLTALLGLAPLAACDPFSPDLGNQPFRCGEDEPKCPDDYECVEYTASDLICEPIGDTGGDDECNDDSSIEPNESTAQSFPTPVAGSLDEIQYAQLAICPASDQDFFRVDIVATGTNLTATATYDEGSAAVQLLLLTNTGTTILAGSDIGERRIQAAASNLAIGTYHVAVSAAAGDTSNYRLAIETP